MCDRLLDPRPQVYAANITERSAEYQRLCESERYDVTSEDLCPRCYGDYLEEMEISGRLEMKSDEWDRGRAAIMAAVHYANGWIDDETYLEKLQNVISNLQEQVIEVRQ
jgi:Zn-finger nucleic acid-binding protein